MTLTLRDDAPAALASTPAVRSLIEALDGEGGETRIVGGAVRNALLGRHVHEIDLATSNAPDETIRLAEAAGFRTIPTGIAHGTVTVLVGGEPFEVTSLREDVETDGRHATVRFGQDFALDAQRRDFTINAMSVGLDGVLHDTTGGLDDLRAGRVRFIGDAGQRIREDYLRVLRFFRFSAEYAIGAVDPNGLDAAIRARDGLAILSRERIRAELLKLLAAERGVEVCGLLSASGLLLRLTGAVAETGRLGRAVKAGLDPPRRLAALLVRTSEDAERLREQLRLSNAEAGDLRAFATISARLRSVPDRLDAIAIRRLAAEHGIPALGWSAAILAGEPRPIFTADGADQLRRYRDGSAAGPVFRLTGGDLVREGVPPGPEVGRILAERRAAWLAEGCPD